MIITLTVIALISTFIWKILLAIYSHLALRMKTIFIPGPFTLPFVASMFTVLVFSQKQLYRLMWNYSRLYKGGMLMLWYANTAILFMFKPHQMEVILKSTNLIKKSSTYTYLKDWLGTGLVTATGDLWHRHRRLLTPAFHFAVLDQFSDVIVDKVNILNEIIRNLVDKNPNDFINFFPMANQFTLDASCKTIMGLDLDVQRKGNNEYIEALHRFTHLTSVRYFTFWFWPDCLFYLTATGKSYRHAIKTMHDFTFKMINEKIKMRKERADANANAKRETKEDVGYTNNITPFLDRLIDLSEMEENPLTLQEVREQVDTFMFAAHDTTGIAISYVLFCLGNTPEAQEKVYNEINQVVGDNDGPATKQQIAQMKYLERVIKESLRIFPSAPFMGRHLTHDVVIDGKVIPKGIEIHMMIMQMHWDPEIWSEPAKFDPDRFLPENSVGRHPYAYIPFSAGPRNCIGQKFALLLMKIALVSILRQWIVYSELAITQLELTTAFVLAPPNQILNLRFEPREKHL